MSFNDGKLIGISGITETVEIKHAHIYVPTGMLRFVEKQNGRMALEQEFCCRSPYCTERFWQVVPVVKEATDD